MFPGGRSSQSAQGGKATSGYYGNMAAVSNPSWFPNPATPVPPPVQYPPRPSAESGRDLLAESYERMRNEMRSLKGNVTSQFRGATSAPPPPSMEEQHNPLSQLLENKDVSLSNLLEAAMDPSIGSNKRPEDPIMKKTILQKCEGKIAQLYRLRISGQGMFFPITEPKKVEFDENSVMTFNHPQIEFNIVPGDKIWTCPDIIIETKKKESAKKESKLSDSLSEKILVANNPVKQEIKVVNPPLRNIELAHQTIQQQLPVANITPLQPQLRQDSLQEKLLQNVQLQYPNVSSTLPPSFPYPPPVQLSHAQTYANPSSALDLWAEIEKERRRKEIENEWDRLMKDKERHDKKRKKRRKKHGSRSSSSNSSYRSRSHSRHRSKSRSRRRSRSASQHGSRSRGNKNPSDRRSHSRRRSRGRSRDFRFRRRSRSFSLSLSPQRKRSRSPLPVSRSNLRHSPPIHRSYHYEQAHSPNRHRSPPSFREEFPDFRSHGPYDAPPPNMPRPYDELSHYRSGPIQPLMDAPPGPPGPRDNYYDYGSGPYPPGVEHYGPNYGPNMPPYGPMGPGPGPRPLIDPHFGPPIDYCGPRPWMGPGPGPGPGAQWFGPPPPMSARGPKVAKTKPLPASSNLVDLTLRAATTEPSASKKPIIVDITDDSDFRSANTKTFEKEAVSKNETPADEMAENKAKVTSNIIPPGVSPDRDDVSHPTKYPNVESELTRPMRTKFRKMLEPLEKVLDTIRLYQRDSFDFKTIIKTLETGKIEFVGVHTLHDGLLCKLEINRNDPDRYFKIVIPHTHSGQVLQRIHENYHDYSVGKVQRLIHELFNDPNAYPLRRIVSTFKRCKECEEKEREERKSLKKKEILILDDTIKTKEELVEVSEVDLQDPMIKPHGEHSRHKKSETSSKRRSSTSVRKSTEKSRTERSGSSNKSSVKSPGKSVVPETSFETYSKFEDLSVRKTDRAPGIRESPTYEESRRSSIDEDNEVKKSRLVEARRSSKGNKDVEGSREHSKNNGKRLSLPSDRKEIAKLDRNDGSRTDRKKEPSAVGRESSRRDDKKRTDPPSGREGPRHDTGKEKDTVAGKVVLRNAAKKEMKSVFGTGSSRNNRNDGPESKGGDDGSRNDAKREIIAPLIKESPGDGKKEKPEFKAGKDQKPGSVDIEATSGNSIPPKFIPPQLKQKKPTVNPDDFKDRVRTSQMAVDSLRSHISDLEGLGKKSSDPTLLLKAGMLCQRLPSSKGLAKPEVKIVVTTECLKQMVEIVHTMAALHAPVQKTVTVFKKHFVPIDGLEKAVSEVLNLCEKC